jgi:hypothetical protein
MPALRLRALFTFGLITVAACTASDDEPAADDSTSADALSGGVALGTELVTTTNVNFRRGPGTDKAIIRVLPAGTTVVAVNSTTPTQGFYDVKAGLDEGFINGGYLTPKQTAPPGCVSRKLTFSADAFPALPAANSAYVWGANATGGDLYLDPPYAPGFVSRAQQARARGLLVFAYLEGPCGDTGGVDDGERARCANIHNAYNARYAPGTPNTPSARWKPFTMKQLTKSGDVGADFCEIDNLDNAVTIPLNPLLAEIKSLYDGGQVHCRIVLKNVDVAGIDSIRAHVAPTPAAANFIAPFHIFEADDTRPKSALDAAMQRLKGPGAVTIISTDTNHYGSAFTPDRFATCN